MRQALTLETIEAELTTTQLAPGNGIPCTKGLTRADHLRMAADAVQFFDSYQSS